MTEHIIYYSQVEKTQPLAVLGMAGSVACGKSTLTKVITGVTTQKHSSELINNASIKLGYTNLKIYHDGEKYVCNPKVINDNYKLVKHLSISDAPGHNSYFASMISGSKFMNLCLFLISGINGIEPQTHQHIKVLKSLGTKNISMIVTKCDQIKNSLAFNDIYDKVIDLLDEYYPCDEETDNIEPPIIPISNTNQININDVIDYVMSIPYPDLNADNRINKKSSLVILRTFDVNRPGQPINKLVGATIGGALTQGNLMNNDLICILPGVQLSDKTYKPLITKVMTLRSDKDSLEIAIPGGFVAISTTLDPSLSKDDKLVGQVMLGISSKEELYNIKITNNIIINDITYFTNTKIIVNEIIVIMYYGATIFGKVISITNTNIEISLRNYIYGNIGDEIMLLKNTAGTLNFFAKAYVFDMHYDDVQLLIDDRELELLITESNFNNRKITCVNDIETKPYQEKDYEVLSKNFITDKKKYDLNKNLELPNITKGTNKFTITNAKNMLTAFFPNSAESKTNSDIDIIKNNRNLIKLMNKFSEIISEKYNAQSFSILDSSVIFNGIKNVKKKINTDGIMQCLITLITKNFCCTNCSQFGTMYVNVNRKICRNCGADISHVVFT